MLLGQLGKKVQAARQADRHKHHDQVPGDIHRGRVHESHACGVSVDVAPKFEREGDSLSGGWQETEGSPGVGVYSADTMLVCAACSIISVLTQWGATLVIQLRENVLADPWA